VQDPQGRTGEHTKRRNAVQGISAFFDRITGF
jgi:hypothetical protein